MFDLFEERLPQADYLVSWVLWRLMRPFMNAPGVRLINALKYHASRAKDRKVHLQSHIGFAFLLDYVPDWRRAYGPSGFIQCQVFIPKDAARATFRDLLSVCQKHGLVPHLGVLKRHRPDGFLLSHAVDGYSLAMDLPARRTETLQAVTEAMTARVLDAGGRFYFAKDSVLKPRDVERAYSRERLDTFLTLKNRLDPSDVLTSDLAHRVFSPTSKRCAHGSSGPYPQ